MALPIFYTSSAKETFVSTYHFIEHRFGIKSAKKFKIRAEKIVKLIAENPLMYKPSVIADNIRIGYISKQTAVFYRVSLDSLDLLFFWDNRQDPIIRQD